MEHPEFNIIGISVKTSNEDGQAGEDILELWKKFVSENVLEKIPDILNSSIYSVYTDYEGDFTKPYTVILGCMVESLDNIPEGMVGRTIPGGKFTKFTARGSLNEGSVYSEWEKIWNSPIERKYTADFEVYDERAQNPDDAEVDIFIAVH